MKRYIYSLLLIIILVSGCKSVDDGGFSHFDEAPLFGMIYDSESSPVVGALVVLDNEKSAKTDINGRVLFSAVSFGDHSVVMTKEDFEEVRMTVNFSSRNQVLYSTLISLQNILDNLERLLQINKLTEAKSFLGRASRITSEDIRYRYLNIVYLSKNNKHERACEEIDLLMESYPDNPYLILTRDQLQKEVGQYNEKN